MHLCGAGAGGLYAKRGFRLLPAQRCGDHSAQRILQGECDSSVRVSSASPIEWHQVVKLLAACTVTVDQVVDVVAYAPTFRALNAGGVIRFFHSLRTRPAI